MCYCELPKQGDWMGTPNGKVALLDAAETLFAKQGYYGASVRDITKLAGVPHGLATYHFKSKDDLYRQVVARRADAIIGLLSESLTASKPSEKGQAASIESILSAYVSAHINFASQGMPETLYLRLTQQFIALGRRRDLIVDLAQAYEPAYERYVGALCKALPDLPRAEIESRFYMMRLVLAGVLVDVDRPGAPDLDARDKTIARIVRFCTGGFLVDNM
jgi:AcrR family transcriptional regulator